MEQITLSAAIRESRGKEAAKKLRRDKKVPAVFYGPGRETLMLSVGYSDLQNLLRKTVGENVIVGLEIESDQGGDTRTVILKELQTDPVKDHILHADFYELAMDRQMAFNIAIQFVNTPVGVTKGGVLQTVRRELNVSCLPSNLVDHIDVDVSGLDIGDALHIEDIRLPATIRPLEEGHLTVAVVVAPTEGAPEEEAEEGAEAEEGEIVEQ